MKPVERRARILELIYDHRQTDVVLLAETLSISVETIRRDLAHLVAEGKIRRTHGGASVLSPLTENAFQTRMQENIQAKRSIAAVAAQLFQAGESLFIDTGSTTLIFAEALAKQQGLSIITNSVVIAQSMARGHGKNNRTFLIGGEYQDEAAENVGSLAVEQIKRFHARHAVLTISAINATGIMDFAPEEAEIARTMVAQAESVTILTDNSKFNQSALFKVCELKRIDRLVVNTSPPPQLAEELQQAQIQVIVAPHQ